MRCASSALPSLLEEGDLVFEFLLDVVNRLLELFFVRHELRRREDDDDFMLRQNLARERVELDDALDFVAEQGHAEGAVLVGRVDFEHIAARAERAGTQVHVVAGVLKLHQLAQDRLAAHFVALADFDNRLRPTFAGRPWRRCTTPTPR